MKRRLALLVCIIATFAMVFAFASCGGNDCDHTYSTEYTSNVDGHWYQATCGCEGEVSNYGAHVDTNNNGECDTCKYAICKHTYSTEWSTNETNHWNEANCGCTGVKKNDAKHDDANKDGICDTCDYVVCAHTYSDWKTDETKHWKEATCGCTVANTEEGAHADGDKDGNCDTCAYVMCEHTFAAEWSTDGAYHWHAATCGCNVVDKKAEHVNEDEDKLCDVCGANICEHTYADVLSYDETNHWYAATCGCDVKKDETAHTWAEAWTINDHKHYYVATCGCEVFKDAADHADEDVDDKCDACGHDTVVSDKIADLDGEAWSGTNSTTINKTEKYDGEEPTTSESYLKVYDNYTVQLDYNGNLRYYSYYGDNGENAFVVLVEGDEARRDEYTTVIEDVYYYSLVYWNVSANNHENMIKGLYNLGLNGGVDWEGNKTGTGYGLISAYDEATSTYSFSYLYVEDTAVYYVEASFTVDAEANGITSANVKIDQYSYASVAVNDDVLSYEIVEGAVAISETTYVIAQAFGDPMDSTEVPNPYPVEDYIVTEDFELVTKDENGEVVNTYNDGDTIELNAMEELVLYFGADILDVIKFNTITLTAIHTETETELSSWSSVGTIKVDTYDDNRPITFVGKQGGAYTLTVDVEGVEVNLNINVKYLAPQTMSTFTINVDSGKGTSESEVTMYNGQSLLINSVVSAGCDPAFVAALTKGDAAALTKNENGTYTFKPEAIGEFEVTLTSSVAETVTAKITITVVTPPTAAEILVGTYEGDFMEYLMQGQKTGTITVVFTPAEEGATNGTLTVNVEGVERTGSYWAPVETPFETNTTFTYTYEDSKIALTRTEGDDVTIELLVTTNYEIAAIYNNSELITLEAVAPVVPEEPSNATTSPIVITTTDNNCYVDEFEFVAGVAGTYTFTVPAGAGVTTAEREENRQAPFVDMQMQTEGGTFTMELTAGQKVVLLIGATEKNREVSISFTVAGAATSTVVTYTGTNADVTPSTITVIIDEANETVTYKYVHPRTGMEATMVYDYVIEDGLMSLYFQGEAVNELEAYVTLVDGVATVAGLNSYAYTLVAEDDDDDEETTSAITGDGSETNPFVVTGAGSTLISGGGFNPIVVQVAAGVTVTIDASAQFYTEAGNFESGVGKTVCPTETTTYYIFADSMAGCTGMMTATAGSSEGGNDQITGSGTEGDPYVLTTAGTYTCAYPGGASAIWYTYTAEKDGTLTLSSTYASAWLGVGETALLADGSNNEGEGSRTISVTAGTTYYIMVGDYNEAAMDVPFTITVE